jgi:CzcA family heavy metal efflux pump
MRWIIGMSLQYRFLVVLGAVVLMFFGIARVREMPVDVFPEFAPPMVEIQTEGPGMSATEVEDLITVQLEQVLNGTPGMDILRSKSVPGLSSIRLIFKPGTDQVQARQLVNERMQIAQSSLPTSAGMTWMLPPLSATSRVMKIGITAKDMDLKDLSMLTYWTIRFRLMQVPGVANVAVWGNRIKMMSVQADPERMKVNDVSLDQVMEVTSEALDLGLLRYSTASKARTGGFIDTANQRFGVQHVLPGIEPEDIARVTIYDKTRGDGKPLRINDVANVVWDTWPMIGDAVINDKIGLMLIVEKFPWGNTLDVTRGVEAALTELQPGLPGVDVDTTIFRPATFIDLAIHNLTNALLVGSILVAIVLLLFLWEWRIALISVVIIPVSLMAAILVLNARGATVNVMLLAGLAIAIGAVVDDAIVDVENIVRRLRRQKEEGGNIPIAQVILEASLEVRSAIVYASLIEISALLPVFFLQGLSGAFFQPLAISYSLAVAASMVVALTLTPAMILILLTNSSALRHREAPFMPWLRSGYERVLTRIVQSPRPVLTFSTLTVIASVAALPFLGQSLLPNFKETDFLMHWVTKPGTSHPEMVRITQRASRELLAIPGVRNFGAHIGRAVAADEVVGVNFTENWISVDPKVNYDDTVHAIKETVEGYPGLVRDVQTYLKERIKEVLSGSSDSIVVRIYGPDLEVLRSKADEVEKVLSGIPGMIDLHKELQVDIPHLQVKADLAKVARYGLKPGDVRRAAATLVAGTEVTDIHKDNKVYDVWVWSAPKIRNSVDNIRDLLIDTPRGGHVRLADVADVQILPTPNTVNRENQSRKINIQANVSGRDLGAVARDVEQAIKKIDFPLEYNAQLLGEYVERQAAQQRILYVGVVAVIAIFFLLQASFGNWRLATLTFLTLPWALIGGVAGAFIGGGILSLGSLVGFLTVLGIATRNGIMMISHYQHLETHEGETFGPGLVLRGAKERLSPILMTALATGLALVPLVIAGNIPGHEIEHPMAIVILGGLVTSTLLNLFVVPTMYLRFGKPRSQLPSQLTATVI